MDKDVNVTIDLSEKEFTSVNKFYQFEPPPEPNWKFYFSDNIKNNIHYYVYLENPPNRFQRWLCYKVFRLTWEKIK